MADDRRCRRCPDADCGPYRARAGPISKVFAFMPTAGKAAQRAELKALRAKPESEIVVQFPRGLEGINGGRPGTCQKKHEG
jgi:hypothetical protein